MARVKEPITVDLMMEVHQAIWKAEKATRTARRLAMRINSRTTGKASVRLYHVLRHLDRALVALNE